MKHEQESLSATLRLIDLYELSPYIYRSLRYSFFNNTYVPMDVLMHHHLLEEL